MNPEPVTISVNQQSIRGNLYTPVTAAKTSAILFIHGWTGKPNNNAARVLVGDGFCAMTFSLRGHNDSDGDIHSISRKTSLDDAVVAYDYLRSRISSDTGIIAVGSSYGAYIAALLSVERPLSALSLRVPANYPDVGFDDPQWGRGHEDDVITKWRNSMVHFSDNRALQALHDFAGPVQIIEAEDDELVPSQTIQNYMAAVPDASRLEYHCMKGWPHSLGSDPQRNTDFQKILLDWLASQEKRL
jgi:esterase/lipase